MFQKRRSMLGRRHLIAQQQAQAHPAQSKATQEGSGSDKDSSRSSLRGYHSGRKRTTSHFDKASKEFKKCLFSKSPGVNYMGYGKLSQDRINYSANENVLNVTGITNIAQTPSKTPRFRTITPASSLQCKERSRYGPNNFTSITEYEKPALKSDSTFAIQSSSSHDFDVLKPPDSPGPSRLERILLEEKLEQNSSSFDFYNLKPPDSPGPSQLEKILMEEKLAGTSSSTSSIDFLNLKPPQSPPPSFLDRLIMDEKLEQPLDPDLKKFGTLSLEDPIPHAQFSPPLSSTCIGSPVSEKKCEIVEEEIIGTTQNSRRKLSTIKDECDVSIIEFEQNEQTICDQNNTLGETTLRNTMQTVMKGTDQIENILEEQKSNRKEEFEPSWENMLSSLDKMERAVVETAESHANEMKIFKEQIELVANKYQSKALEQIKSIKSLKDSLESLKRTAPAVHSNENKENDFSFRVPTCKKTLMAEENKWFNSVKKENPRLIKTPNSKRILNQPSTLTPHSFSKVLHDQMNELYRN